MVAAKFPLLCANAGAVAKAARGDCDHDAQQIPHSSGIYEFLPLEEVAKKHFHKQFNLNVLGPILASMEAVKYLKLLSWCRPRGEKRISPRAPRTGG
jgi:hypothetical protein